VQPRITLCSICHSPMPPGKSICSNCGAMLCPHCREPLPQRSRFCPKCGFLCIAEQPGPITQQSQPASSARQQAMPIPRVSSAPPQPAAQAAMRQQSSGVPVPQLRNNCPRCGADIDLESGRCSGCGLLYGIRHRAIQQQAASATSARPPLVPRPQTPAVQQPPAARGMMPQYGSPQHSPPVSSGQRQNYGSPGAMPGVGMQLPIPSAAPAAAGAVSAGLTPPAMAAKPYPYQAAPPAPGGRGIPAAGKRGLPGIATIIIVLIVCLFIGGGIYYFVNQGDTSSPTTDDIVYSTPPSIRNVSASSITETGATITWKTDKPTRGKIEYWKTETENPITRLDENLSTSHSVTLPELDPNTTYYFKVTSTDAAGNEASDEGNLTTLAEADETPPVISGVSYSNVTESSAIITWTTNEDATRWVEYGATEECLSKTTENTSLSTSHSVTLTELDDDTTYYFKVISKDGAGNKAELADNHPFTTKSIIPVGYEVDKLAPEFSLNDIYEKEWKLRDFRGKIVMVNFWATWCGPCINEMPHLQEIAQGWSVDLKIFAITSINNNQSERDVLSFVQANQGYTFTVLLDPEGEVATEYGFTDNTSIPRTFFIDAEGIIKEIKVDAFSDAAEIEDILDTLQEQ